MTPYRIEEIGQAPECFSHVVVTLQQIDGPDRWAISVLQAVASDLAVGDLVEVDGELRATCVVRCGEQTLYDSEAFLKRLGA